MDGLALDQMVLNIPNPPAILDIMGGDKGIDTSRVASEPAGCLLDEPCRKWLLETGAGNEEALGALYDATASRVYGLILRIVGNRASAEDVTQSVYLQLWRDATKFDPARGKPMTWILTIARLHAPEHTALRDFLTVREDEGEWQEFSAGLYKKPLFNDGENEAFLVRMEPGARCPPHDHHADEECVVLSGEVWLGDIFVRAGDFHLAPKGRSHAEIYSPKGVLLYIRTGVARE